MPKKSKKKKAKKPFIHPIPPLSFKVLHEVQAIEDYAKAGLNGCVNSGYLNDEAAKRILTTCTVNVLDKLLAFYQPLPEFHEQWVFELQRRTVDSALTMLPHGFGQDIYPEYRKLLWDTLYAHLDRKKVSKAEKAATAIHNESQSIANQIRTFRNECLLSREELAEQIGIDVRSIKRHETGKAKPYPKHLRSYQEVFSKLLNKPVTIRP
jgi:DNA-binding XRE family transcriptional regulator